jgi:microcin C transport system permease protein
MLGMLGRKGMARDKPEKSISVFRRRWRKFRTLKRGWYSFLILLTMFIVSLFSELLVNGHALVVRYQGETYFPAFSDWLSYYVPGYEFFYEAEDFGQRKIGAVDFRKLRDQYAEADEGDWVLMPLYPFGPIENFLRDESLEGNPPHKPGGLHALGTDHGCRDVLARLAYGFRISIVFALCVVAMGYLIGTAVGATLGFFGGRVDIYGQRLVEIWSGLPFLYTVIIVSSIVRPNVKVLIFILSLFMWMSISYYMRGEFYREKSKDYVAAAIAQGEGRIAIMFRHILPNALTPIVSFAPFATVATISSLVALDFLGFGLPAPTPSWGEMVHQGLSNIQKWHLVVFPLGCLFMTLLLVVFIGEAIREAFDPKVFSRLR